MRTRTLAFGLYADEQGLAWVEATVRAEVARRTARIVGLSVSDTVCGGSITTADMYDLLAEQWAFEHPGQDPGSRVPVELRVRLTCSLRTRRTLRKAVIRALCPEGSGPHLCRVPWMAC